MSTQHLIWSADGAALAIALVAGVADWRRVRRHTIHGWGWMPWRGLQITAFFVMAVLTVVALRG